jgi:hypothetical protein
VLCLRGGKLSPRRAYRFSRSHSHARLIDSPPGNDRNPLDARTNTGRAESCTSWPRGLSCDTARSRGARR